MEEEKNESNILCDVSEPNSKTEWVSGVITEDWEVIMSDGRRITYLKEEWEEFKKDVDTTKRILEDLGGKKLMKMFKKKLKKKYNIKL